MGDVSKMLVRKPVLAATAPVWLIPYAAYMYKKCKDEDKHQPKKQSGITHETKGGTLDEEGTKCL